MYVVTTASQELLVEAEEHAVEGRFHVFRATTTVMGRPRTVVVRRLPLADVLTVTLSP